MLLVNASELRITFYRDGLEIEGNTPEADQVARNVFGPGPWRIAANDSQYGEALRQCNALIRGGATFVNQFGESIANYCKPWPKDLTPPKCDTFELPKLLVYACTTLIAFGLVAIGYIIGVVAS